MHLSRIGPLVVMSWLLSQVSAFAQPGLEQRVKTLETEIAALTEQIAALSQTSTTADVDCGNGQSIQAALAQIQFRPNQVTAGTEWHLESQRWARRRG